MAIFPKLVQKPPKMAHHNLDHYFRDSFAVGPIVPILVEPVNAGDDKYLDFNSLVNTQALLSPLYGSYKLKIEVFFAGISLYCPKLWRNGTMKVSATGKLDVNFPTFPAKAASGSMYRVDPSSLLAHLGYPGDYSLADGQQHNAIPLLMYWDIFRHYYANRQEDRFPIFGGFSESGVFAWERLSDLDDAFLTLPVNGGALGFTPGFTESFGQCHLPLGGYALRTYMPDMMNVILNSEFYEKNVASVQVSTAGDTFQIDQFVTAKKLWNSMNKDALSNGTFKDWVRIHFGVTPKIMDDMPTFLGSTTTDIIFEDIRATTSANLGDGEKQYLGDKGSSGLGYAGSRRFHFVADRPGYIMAVASIVPSVDYYQRLERWTLHTKLSDMFDPDFNGIGLQDVLVSDLCASQYPSDRWVQQDFQQAQATQKRSFENSVGKQPAFIEYMTAVNRIRGSFCTTERSWVLARDFLKELPLVNPNDTINEGPVGNIITSAYIDPTIWNQSFAVQSPDAMNFLVQFHITNRTRSTVLKRIMPHL